MFDGRERRPWNCDSRVDEEDTYMLMTGHTCWLGTRLRGWSFSIAFVGPLIIISRVQSESGVSFHRVKDDWLQLPLGLSGHS